MKRLLVILIAAGLGLVPTAAPAGAGTRGAPEGTYRLPPRDGRPGLVPTAAAAGAGTGVALEGTYRLLHGDGRPGGPSTTMDYLEVGRSHYLLQFAQRPTLHPGERLRVEGTLGAAPAGSAGAAL